MKLEKSRISCNSLWIYGRYYEMPQKACERYIFHVMAYAFFWNAQNSKTFNFSVFFVRILIMCFFNARFSIHSARKLLELFENRAFQYKRIYENRTLKNTWWEFEQNRERNWKCSNFGHFKKMHMPSREKYMIYFIYLSDAFPGI